MSREYRFIQADPNKLDQRLSVIRYDFEYRDTPAHNSKVVSLLVDFTFVMTREIATHITGLDDIKKVIWEYSRKWFEDVLLKQFPGDGIISFPREQMDTAALLDYNPANISYPTDWTALEEEGAG